MIDPKELDAGRDVVTRLKAVVRESVPRRAKGRVRRLLGVMIHATITDVRLGELCELIDPSNNRKLIAEVVGIIDDQAVLTPIGDMAGLSNMTEVLPLGEELRVPVGNALLGRTISALGEPLDGSPLQEKEIEARYPVHAHPPSPFSRTLVSEPIQLGIRALDGLLTCGRGQRMGVFGEPGLGKSTMLAEIARNSDADVVVVGLVGERGREVREFIDRQLTREAREKMTLVVATSDRPAMERVKAAYVATTIAEYFRDQGKHVLLLLDSITRFARAQREIGLAAGEPPTRRGFPPSLFAALPRLLERAGTTENGSITGIYSILVEGDSSLDPVSEEMQAILDGHIVLSSQLAERDHFPAIDVLRSRSRLMDIVTDQQQRTNAAHIRTLLSRYNDVELLVRVGEYEKGSDKIADEAVSKIDRLNAFLQQPAGQRCGLSETLKQMQELCQ